MDASRFVRGLSVSPAKAHVSRLATSAPAQVSVGPSSQRHRNHPSMFLRPLGHLIWPGNKTNNQNHHNHNHTNNNNNSNNSSNNHHNKKKLQEGHVDALETSTSTEERKVSYVLNGLGSDLLKEEEEEEQHVAGSDQSTSDLHSDVAEREESTSDQEGWVMKILRVRSIWEEEGAYRTAEIESETESDDQTAEMGSNDVAGCLDGCDVDSDGDDDVAVVDRDSFGRFLSKVGLEQAKDYAKMSYLSNLAYCIERIKPQNLLKFHRLRLVTSSLDSKKPTTASKSVQKESSKPQINPSEAYNNAAQAASYHLNPLQSKSPNNPLQSEPDWRAPVDSSIVATTNSVTAVVSAKEERKEEIVEGLKNSPCDWFVCDCEESNTRYIVIQGSESLASWQANLLFEPVQFEGLDVLVHRGIYSAAKGIYSQLLPFIQSRRATSSPPLKLQFTGHSLGGSLSLLINLMLLIRGEISHSALLPVVTFGAPAVLCGGDYLLSKLGLGKEHVHAVTMHRDIVPRAFSCSYPDNVARILKAVSANFRRHPCLAKQKVLYAPMGKLVILQPDARASPAHHLLPPGLGLYSFRSESRAGLKSALSAFMNSPHPLEILSDRGAYGPLGTVLRDHDMNAYLKSLRSVIRQELKLVKKNRKTQKPHVWWPLVVPSGTDPCIIMSSSSSRSDGHHKFDFSGRVDFSGMFRGGKETLIRFKRLVASRHVNLLVLVLFPARFLILGPLALVRLI